MAHPSTYEPNTGIERWLDARLPVPRLMHDQFLVFPTPRNLNYWWTFGGILTFMLVAQIATGVVLAMHYVPTEDGAFDSVEKIMRDVNWGWLLRYSHAVGASMFFVAVYIHTFRGLYYGSYKAPREVLWILGVLILLLMIATAFMGYSLVWGQMSFWAVTVITNLFSSLDSVVPGLGTRLVEWIWGGFSVGGPDAEPALRLALSLPLHHRRRRGPAYLGAAYPGQQQPDRHRREDGEGHRAVPSLLHDQGRLRAGRVHPRVRGDRVLCAELARPSRQLRSGQPAADAAAYRAGMVFPAVLRDPARDPEQAVRRDRAAGVDRHPLLRAVARHLEGAVDQLPADLQMVLLGVRGDVPRARLSRLAAA